MTASLIVCWSYLDLLLQLQMESSAQPNRNGQAELVFRAVKKYLTCMVEKDTLNWPSLLSALQVAHNSCVSLSLYESPHAILFGRQPHKPWALNFSQVSESEAAEHFRRLQAARLEAEARNAEVKSKYVEYYNRKASTRKFHARKYMLCS